MLGSIYVGLSGMNAFSRGLQAISNNVANLNSPGYKASTVTFSDVFSVGGLGSGFSQGRLAGQGVRFGNQSIDFTQGDVRQTGGDLDLAVQGSGFLVLTGADGPYYARTGQFGVDGEGFVSLLGSTYRLNILDESGRASPVNVDDHRISRPEATRNVRLSGNVSTGSIDVNVSDVIVHDARGGRHVWKINLKPSTETPSVPGKWSVTVTDETGAIVDAPKALQFSLAGAVTDPSQLSFSYTGDDGEATSVTLDFGTVTSFSAGTTSSLRASTVDGVGLGTLTSVTITEAGTVSLTYSNSRTEDLGAVALAAFRDPQALERTGGGVFRNTGDAPTLASSAQTGVGTLVSRQIEASNVDLAQQFGDLILVQRGFQASSQVVSVSNDMIQQLFGIRGQG